MNRTASPLRALGAVAIAAAVPLALVVPAIGAGSAAAGVSAATKPAAPYVPVRAAGQPWPATPSGLTAAIEEYAEYQGQSLCSPSPKPGALKVAALLRATYGPADIGIARSCGDGGQSEHKEGRALDWMLSYRVPAERAKVEAFLAWLLAKDAYGNPGANARRLGIMYVGWHDRIWRSYDATAGWKELKGCFATPGRGYDTYCHRDHAHLTMSWDAAAGLTSFFDATVDTREVCPEPSGGASAQKLVPTGSVRPVAAWRLVNTISGSGVGAPCRLSADRWSYDNRLLRLPVLGRHGVPSRGVAAVKLKVAVSGVNAPTSVVVSATGSRRAVATTVDGVVFSNVAPSRFARRTSTVIVAPVASNGTVTLANLFGAVDVRVDVVGWLAGKPKPTPTPTPAPTPTPVPPAPSSVGRFPVPAYPGTPITIGAKGPAVVAVQKSLLARGYPIPSLSAKLVAYGTFAKETLAAVKAYQVKTPQFGSADGIIGPKTYAALTSIGLTGR